MSSSSLIALPSAANGQLVSTSFGLFPEQPAIELYKKDPAEVGQQIMGAPLEANLWLPFAAKHYQLSPKLEDYVMTPIPGLYNDIPNTNGDCVTLQQLLRFDPELGMQAFKTFRGKPAYQEHDNQNITRAKGVILDCFIRPIKKFGNGRYYKVVMLVGYDRTKDPLLVNRIIQKKSNAYSVGFYYNQYVCVTCGQRFNSKSMECSHTSLNLKSPIRRPYIGPDGRLRYRLCENINGFEISSVTDPAFILAANDYTMAGWE